MSQQPPQHLWELGPSLWLDFIQRGLVRSGRLDDIARCRGVLARRHRAAPHQEAPR